MAVIQLRSGVYSDYDPARMQAAEPAVILSGDPDTEDGKSVRVGFGSGVDKRLLTEDDIPDAKTLTATNIGSGVVSLSLE